MSKLSKCKITIIKRTINKDLIEEYLIEDYKDMKLCERFKDAQEFIIDPNSASVPENFCDWAWADIRQDIATVASGGKFFWLKNPKMTISCCSDWFRPVYFKIENIEPQSNIENVEIEGVEQK